MKTSILFFLCMAFGIAPAHSQAVSQDPIGDARRAIGEDADFDAARQFLEAFESYALEATPPVSSEDIAEMNFLLGVLEFYLNQDEEAARTRWLWTLQINEEYAWDSELVGGAGEGIFEEVRKDVTSTNFFSFVPAGKHKSRPMFVDGQVVSDKTNVLPGQHLVQAKCSDGRIRGVYVYLNPGNDVICPCPLDACFEKGSKKAPRKNRRGEGKGEYAFGLSGGAWFSAGEGSAPLIGGSWSARTAKRMVVVDLGAYLSVPQQDRANGFFGSLAYSWVRPTQGAMEWYYGVDALLVLADDRERWGHDEFWLWSGFVGGVHGGMMWTTEAGHQLGAQLGYSPVVIEGELIVYMNSVSHLFYRLQF